MDQREPVMPVSRADSAAGAPVARPASVARGVAGHPQWAQAAAPMAVPSDLTLLPVHTICERMARQQLSPVDLVDALLAKIRSANGALHAFVDVYAGDARLAAEAAHKAIRSGHAVGPLHGVPIALKDVIEIEGRIVTGGSKIRLHRRAQRTATLARRLIEKGVIVLGKTHTVEFALGAWGTNEHMGTPWNPWHRTVHHAPGGSSGGSAVAVAAGLAPWAVGTDTGGSVRIPSALCGIVGLKPTRGLISSHGVLPLSPTLDTPGPMARSVEDAALLFNAMQGPDPCDAAASHTGFPDPLPSLKRGIAGLRLGCLPPTECEEVAPELLLAYHAALEVMAGLGARIVEVVLPRRLSDYTAKTIAIIMAESHALYGHLADDPLLPLDARVRDRLLAGASVSATEYLSAIHAQSEWRQEFARVFDMVDAILTPATRTPALPLDRIDHKRAPTTFTRFVNFLQLCAVVVPDGFTAEGLPSALQIVCRDHSEAMALRIAWAYQNATEWHARRPPLPSDTATQPDKRP
jgi:aspartyl-tRNA(Asn)/glutamyl-tRNA(Gln) amidotransferase subunit A